jgi:hypothetical protein
MRVQALNKNAKQRAEAEVEFVTNTIPNTRASS